MPYLLRPDGQAGTREVGAVGMRETRSTPQAVIHYHGTPITPRESLLELAGRSFCVSFAHPRDVRTCHEIGQSESVPKS